MKKICLCLIFCNLAVFLQAQTIRYVKQGGSGTGNNWANASGDFQAMITASSAGDEVWVAAGDYQTPVGVAFKMKEGVKLFGGFPDSGDPVWSDRNWTANTTRLLGNLKNWASNGNRVIENNDLTGAAVLDGFTVMNGTCISPDHGGGMHNNNASPEIRNCVFNNNYAGNEGGGMYNSSSSPVITNCTFSNNQSGVETDGSGGGMANYHSNPVITNCDFNNNRSMRGGLSTGGGGMFNVYSSPVVTNCSFTGNHAYTGGGVYNYICSPQFINTRFSQNTSAQTGGAVRSFGTSTVLYKNCFFTGNTSDNGAGASNEYYSVSTFINCLFHANNANGTAGNGRGGAIFSDYAESRFYNCTITDNNAALYGGSIFSTGIVNGQPPNVLIRNSILHGNNSGIYLSSNIGNFENSLIDGYTPNGGTVMLSVANIMPGATDPLFVDRTNAVGADGVWGTTDDGLRLREISPVVNKGSNAAVPADALVDLAGFTRIQGGNVDLGAYESPYTINCSASTLYVDANRPVSGSGDSWGTAFKTLSEAMEKARLCYNVNTILVARGTYYPTGQQNGTHRDSAFLIPQRGGIKLYGGYPSGGGVRNTVGNPTILSGDIGTAGDNSDNSYHLLVITETLPGADSVVIDGFTLTNANADGGQYYYNGALTNQNEGGAILFRRNINLGSKSAIRHCNIIDNIASSNGAGIYLRQTSAFISHCVISGNRATNGAGIFNFNNTDVKVINSVLTGNRANNGAAIYNSGTTLGIVNSTIYANTGIVQGGGIYNTGSSNATVVNSILYQNVTSNIYNAALLNITYSNVQQSSGVFAGTGNINADPLLVNAASGAGPDGIWRTADDGFKIQPGSPLINAGTPDITGLPLTPADLEGLERVRVSRIDMGAYESLFTICDPGGTTLYVDGNVSQSGNGSSWAAAFKSLVEAVEALDGCVNVNTILVAGGTYYPTTALNRDASIVIPRRGNVKIYGGYPNGGGARNLAAYSTILSGDIGVLNDNVDNCFHVMAIANINAGADSVIIDGFTFTGANANGSGNTTLNGISVSKNLGGGITFVNNNGNSRMVIRNCRFVSNKAYQGAGIYCTASSPRIISSWLQSNRAEDNGGAMSNYDNSNPFLINVVITGNKAVYAGAVFNDRSRPTFINSTVADNYALGDVGGIYNRYPTTYVTFINSVIYGNRNPDGSPSNILNTISGNAGFTNSLIENISGAWEDLGKNLFVDPQFVTRINPTDGNTPNASGNYKLQASSPGIDAGDNAALPAGIGTDIENAIRQQQAAIDMGAFESSYFNCGLFAADITHSNVKCFGAADGTASVTVTHGVAPYNYSWSNGSNTASVSGLLPGNYSCTITDANGCSVIKNVTITETVTALAAAKTLTDAHCAEAPTGAAKLTVTGGVAPYSYNWSNGATTSNISFVLAGPYTCTVTDANGCSISATMTINEPDELVATSVKTDNLCYGNNTGTASVQLTGGTAPYSYSWTHGPTDASLTDLAPGNYYCNITDAKGCGILAPVSINGPAAALSIVPSKTDLLCFNDNTGKASVSVSGGTAAYDYAWSNGAETATIDNIAAGTYTCTVKDANGCELTETITLTEPPVLNASVGLQVNVYCGAGAGAAQIQVSGGAVPYAYLWSNGNTGSLVSGLTPGNYTCEVSDVNGCSVNVPVTITQQAYSGNKIFVDSSVTVSGDGTGWAQAIKELSDAFNIANSCPGIDSILIAKGTYTPVGNSGINNRDSVFLVRQSGGQKMYGGYPSGGGIRNVANNITTLSADLNIPGYNGDNSGHIMVIAGLGTGADSVVIDGITFSGGYGLRSNYHYNGIEVNGAAGGGICLYDNNDAGGKITIRNCHFTGNFAYLYGGAIYCNRSSPVIVNCKFSFNEVVEQGGALLNDLNSDVSVIDCEFTGNKAGGGGAVYNGQNSNARIIGSRFTENLSSYWPGGGAICNENSSPLITNCFIGGNKTDNSQGGGGVHNRNNSAPVITNTIFVGNIATGNYGTYGGAMASFTNSAATVTNCTFYGNNSRFLDESIYNDASHLDMKNSIVYGTSYGIWNVSGGTASVMHSLVAGWTGGGTGNLPQATDPGFTDPYIFGGSPFTEGNYQLRPCSPAINTGTADTTGLNLPADEFVTGRPRVQLGRIDMGAYETNSNANDQSPSIASVDASASLYQLKDSTTWYSLDCSTLIAKVAGSGAHPVSGNTTASVNIDAGLLPGRVGRSYEIIPDNDPESSTGSITLLFTQDEFDAYNTANGSTRYALPHKDDPQVNDKIANIRVRQLVGSLENTITPDAVSWNAAYERWELQFGVTGFGSFYVFTELNGSLPLRLISFTAKEEECVAKINWLTAEESGVSHFELEYSADGAQWTFLSRTGAMNTAGEHRYAAQVNINEVVNFYRLKMLDIDGTVTYSKILRLVAPQNCIGRALRLYPNPAKDIVYVEKANAGDHYSFYDNAGRLVMQGVIRKSVQDINVTSLLPGVYSVVIVNRTGQAKVVKFIRK